MVNIFTKFISNWLREIVLLFIIISMIDIIMPKGKMKRYVNFIIGILIIFTIISPITKLKNISLNLDREVSKFTNSSIPVSSMAEIQEEQIKGIYMSNLKNELKDMVEKSFDYKVKDLKIHVIPDKEQIFIVDSIDLILSSENARENKSKIKIEKIEVGEEITEVANIKQDKNLQIAISNYIQIDQDKVNISIIDKEDKNGGYN